MKDLLRTSQLSVMDFKLLLKLSEDFKANPYLHKDELKNDTVAMYFNKPSTRTRISFETAITRLGGVPIMLGGNDLQLGRGETISDTAHVISRFCKAFIIRTYKDSDVEEFSREASIPVINALTDGHHPCQSLADMLTLREKMVKPLSQCKIAYIGDGNNVAISLMQAAVLCGTDVAIATPKGYEVDEAIVNEAKKIAQETECTITITNDPKEAAKGSDALYTDVWLSMGDPDSEKEKRLNDFKDFEIDDELMSHAEDHAIFMHCLPAHRGEEVSAEVADGPRSVIFDQAENRLHSGIAILYALITGKLSGC